MWVCGWRRGEALSVGVWMEKGRSNECGGVDGEGAGQ